MRGEKERRDDPQKHRRMVRLSGRFVHLFSISFISVSIYCLSFYPAPVCGQSDFSTLVNKIIPSVVVINVFNRDGKWRGGGTGFFVKEEGLLVTNYHVIDGKVRAVAKLSNGEFLPVEGVLSEDSNGDLVLLTLGVCGMSFPTLSLGNAEIETGEPIVVIGSPSGLQGTVSDGIVSEVRDVPNLGKIIQHTAATSPGSSGSPVLNMEGEVIGVVVGSIVGGQSFNFAISVERVKGLLSHSQATPRELVELVNRDEVRWDELLLNGRYEELISSLTKRIQVSQHNAKAYFFLGLAFAGLSRSNEAIEAYNQAIRIEPDDSDLYYSLGVSYIRSSNYKEAIKAFKKAVRIKPDDAEAFLNLGFSYGELGHRNEAIEAYKQAIRIKPDFVEAHYNLGEAYLKAKKKAMSIEQYRVLKNLDSELANKLFDLIYK